MTDRPLVTHLALDITATSADPAAKERVEAEVRRLLLALDVPGVNVVSVVLAPRVGH